MFIVKSAGNCPAGLFFFSCFAPQRKKQKVYFEPGSKYTFCFFRCGAKHCAIQQAFLEESFFGNRMLLNDGGYGPLRPPRPALLNNQLEDAHPISCCIQITTSMN